MICQLVSTTGDKTKMATLKVVSSVVSYNSTVHFVVIVGNCGRDILHAAVTHTLCIARLLLRAGFIMMPAPSIKLCKMQVTVSPTHAQVMISY